MSHKVTIDFESVTMTAKAHCASAAEGLNKITKKLEFIRANARKIRDEKLKEYESYLENSKNTLEKNLDSYVTALDEFSGLKNKIVDLDTNYLHTPENISLVNKWNEVNELVNVRGNELIKSISDLTGAKLSVIEEMVNNNLLANIDKINDEFNARVNGRVIIDNELLEKINSIEDISLRTLAHQQMVAGLKNFDEILSKAKSEYNRLLNGSSYMDEVKEELQKGGVEKEKIEAITNKELSIDNATSITAEANEAIKDETVRKEALKVIIKSIRSRGFIVDTKNNLKIDRKRNIVILVAKKPDGKRADFEISLNGKFMYHFDGYEGQACMKDITPFVDDLKNIYDVNVLHEEIEWSNPDKLQTKKYQYINTNKAKM